MDPTPVHIYTLLGKAKTILYWILKSTLRTCTSVSLTHVNSSTGVSQYTCLYSLIKVLFKAINPHVW